MSRTHRSSFPGFDIPHTQVLLLCHFEEYYVFSNNLQKNRSIFYFKEKCRRCSAKFFLIILASGNKGSSALWAQMALKFDTGRVVGGKKGVETYTQQHKIYSSMFLNINYKCITYMLCICVWNVHQVGGILWTAIAVWKVFQTHKGTWSKFYDTAAI